VPIGPREVPPVEPRRPIYAFSPIESIPEQWYHHAGVIRWRRVAAESRQIEPSFLRPNSCRVGTIFEIENQFPTKSPIGLHAAWRLTAVEFRLANAAITRIIWGRRDHDARP
jgi:hypothetical protein